MLKIFIALTALIVALAAAAPSDARRARVAVSGHATLISGDGTEVREQALVDRTRIAVPTRVITIFHFSYHDPCGAAACAVPGSIYLGSSASDEDVLHELGHQFDYFVMDARGRYEFQSLTKSLSRAWRTSPNSPHEQFAEAYSMCARYGYAIPSDLSMAYGLMLSKKSEPRVCAVIRRVAARNPQGPR